MKSTANNLKRKRAVGYVRFSSDNQRPESNEEQKQIIERYAKANNIEVIKIFDDEAISGTSTKGRSGLENMLDYLRKNMGSIDYVLAHKLDRIARNTLDYYKIKNEINKSDAELICINDGLDTGSEVSILMEAMLSASAMYMSANLAKEVMRGLEYNAERGLSTGGIPPLGYNLDTYTSKLVINPQEAECVKLIFKRYGEDGYSYSEIVDELNSKGYRTKKGNTFKKNSLTELFRNEKYIGVYTFNKTASKSRSGKRNGHKMKSDDEIIRVTDGCPRLISDDLWNKVQERRKETNSSYSTKHYYPLKGKIVCGSCNSTMGGNYKLSGANKKRYVTYDCSGRKSDKMCKMKGINADYINLYTALCLKRFLINRYDPSKTAQMLNDYLQKNNSHMNDELKNAKNQLRLVQDKINNIGKIIEKDTLSRDIFRDKLHILNDRKTSIELQINQICHKMSEESISPKEIDIIVKRFAKNLLKNEPTARKVIQTYLDKVIVDDENIEVLLKTYRDIKTN